MESGIELIAIERQEQIEKHGWDANHDDDHFGGALLKAAATLCANGTDVIVQDPDGEWGTGDDPWGLESKLDGDKNKIHRLKVAGALIAAEIDRIQRTPQST